MSNKRFLVISDVSVFILDIAMDQLKNAGYSYAKSVYKTEDISEAGKDCDYFVLYVDENTKTHKIELDFINNLCLMQKKTVVLLGNQEDIYSITMHFMESVVSKQIPRPFTSKEIRASLEALYSKEKGEGTDKEKEEEKRKHILVVDDSGPTLLTIKRWLEKKYDVTVVNSANNAITFLELKGTIDLILLDYEMPVCNGGQMLEKIREIDTLAKTPVIFLTGKADQEVVSRILELKPQGYLLKSMPSEDIVERIDEFFATCEEES